MLNVVQKAAYELIQADARFLYTLTVIQRCARNINSNYIMMSQPYIGLFTDGAEQWCQKLAGFFDCQNFPPYNYDDSILVKYEDYHFYKNCPLNTKTELGFLLFSILCSVNYAIEFIDRYFVEEIPQKFKFAYLQYYYLCDFIKELNAANGTTFYINDSMKDRAFRNCLAHYGLGQYLSESDLIDDVLKGLTNKAFDMNYSDAKDKLYFYLTELTNQIEAKIFSQTIENR